MSNYFYRRSKVFYKKMGSYRRNRTNLSRCGAILMDIG